MKFIIKKNSDLDKSKFISYLFDPNYLKKRGHVKDLIIKFYKIYKDNIEDIDNQIKITDLTNIFLDEKYTQFDKKINEILELWEKLFNKNSAIIDNGFIETLGYDTKDDIVTLSPSFLPAHTFGGESIYFSVVMQTFRDFNINYFDIFLHEYTHIIWSKLLKDHSHKVDKLTSIGYDYLKEFIPPLVIRHSYWDGVRQGDDHKYANSRQQLLNIKVDGETHNFVNYLEKIYIKNNYGTGINTTINDFLDIIIMVESQIELKHKIYNKIGFDQSNTQESKNKLNYAGFMEPIIVKL